MSFQEVMWRIGSVLLIAGFVVAGLGWIIGFGLGWGMLIGAAGLIAFAFTGEGDSPGV